MEWTGLIWLGMGTGGGVLWTRWSLTFWFHKMWEISRLTEELLASKEGNLAACVQLHRVIIGRTLAILPVTECDCVWQLLCFTSRRPASRPTRCPTPPGSSSSGSATTSWTPWLWAATCVWGKWIFNWCIKHSIEVRNRVQSHMLNYVCTERIHKRTLLTE